MSGIHQIKERLKLTIQFNSPLQPQSTTQADAQMNKETREVDNLTRLPTFAQVFPASCVAVLVSAIKAVETSACDASDHMSCHKGDAPDCEIGGRTLNIWQRKVKLNQPLDVPKVAVQMRRLPTAVRRRKDDVLIDENAEFISRPDFDCWLYIEVLRDCLLGDASERLGKIPTGCVGRRFLRSDC